jgi:biotin synthase
MAEGAGVSDEGAGVDDGAGASRTGADGRDDILDAARGQVLGQGRGLDEPQILRCLELPDGRLSDLLSLAHDVRMRWCGPDVEVEGIVSVKTGGCPEDCHFCSQSGQFESPVRSVWLDIDELVAAARETAATGATEFCIVAAVRGPDERLMTQIAAAVRAIRDEVDINVACSLGILTDVQAGELAALGVHRYNHNLETARSYFGHVVTTHGWEERFATCQLVRQLSALEPDEVPLNFLNPRPGTPLGDRPLLGGTEALRTIAAFRLALPRAVLRYAGGRELTLGDLGTEAGMLGGINAIIVGNYLTTLGRPAQQDLDMLTRLHMPIKALSSTL